MQEFGIDIDVTRPLSNYSTAVQQMVAIARAVSTKAQLVIMDEPTSSLDVQEVQLLFGIMYSIHNYVHKLKVRPQPGRVVALTEYGGYAYPVAGHMYIDYETQKQIYLCAQPNCTHQDERCTSWVAPQNELVTPVVLDENLLLVHNSTEAAPYIEILNLDGTDKKLLYQFAANTEIVNGIAYNGQAIALMTRQYDNTDPAAVKVRFALVGIRLADKQAAELYAYEPEEGNVTKAGSASIFLLGTTADGFVCKTVLLQNHSTESNDPETIANNMLGNRPICWMT